MMQAVYGLNGSPQTEQPAFFNILLQLPDRGLLGLTVHEGLMSKTLREMSHVIVPVYSLPQTLS